MDKPIEDRTRNTGGSLYHQSERVEEIWRLNAKRIEEYECSRRHLKIEEQAAREAYGYGDCRDYCIRRAISQSHGSIAEIHRVAEQQCRWDCATRNDPLFDHDNEPTYPHTPGVRPRAYCDWHGIDWDPSYVEDCECPDHLPHCSDCGKDVGRRAIDAQRPYNVLRIAGDVFDDGCSVYSDAGSCPLLEEVDEFGNIVSSDTQIASSELSAQGNDCSCIGADHVCELAANIAAARLAATLDLSSPRHIQTQDLEHEPTSPPPSPETTRWDRAKSARLSARFPRTRQPQRREIYDIETEDDYREHLRGVSTHGDGRPQLPRDCTISPTMLAFHEREVKAWERRKNDRHFDKLYSALRRRFDDPRTDRLGASAKQEKKLRKRMRKIFERTGRLTIENFTAQGQSVSRAFTLVKERTTEKLTASAVKGAFRGIGELAQEQYKSIVDSLYKGVFSHLGDDSTAYMSAVLRIANAIVIAASPLPVPLRVSTVMHLLNIGDGLAGTAIKALTLSYGAFKLFKRTYELAPAEDVGSDDMVAQYLAQGDSDASKDAAGESLIGMCAAGLGFAGIAIPMAKRLKAFNLYASAIKSAEHLITLIYKIIKWIVNAVWKKMYGVPWLPDSVMKIYSEVMEWNQFLDEYHINLAKGVSKHVASRNFMSEYTNRYLPLHKRMSTDTEHNAELRLFWAETSRRTTEAHKMCKDYIEGVGGRQQPVAMLLCGATNVGKSTVAMLLSAVLARALDIKYTRPAELMYARNRNDPFWSSYDQQLVVVFDELLAGDFKEEAYREGREVLSSVNPMDFHLPMAELADKGKPFTSPFLFATSNIGADERVHQALGLPSSVRAALTSPAAVFRRFNAGGIYRVRLANPLGDAPTDEQIMDGIHTSWVFDRYDPVSSGNDVTFEFREELSLAQVVARLVDAHRSQRGALASRLMQPEVIDRILTHVNKPQSEVQDTGAGVFEAHSFGYWARKNTIGVSFKDALMTQPKLVELLKQDELREVGPNGDIAITSTGIPQTPWELIKGVYERLHASALPGFPSLPSLEDKYLTSLEQTADEYPAASQQLHESIIAQRIWLLVQSSMHMISSSEYERVLEVSHDRATTLMAKDVNLLVAVRRVLNDSAGGPAMFGWMNSFAKHVGDALDWFLTRSVALLESKDFWMLISAGASTAFTIAIVIWMIKVYKFVKANRADVAQGVSGLSVSNRGGDHRTARTTVPLRVPKQPATAVNFASQVETTTHSQQDPTNRHIVRVTLIASELDDDGMGNVTLNERHSIMFGYMLHAGVMVTPCHFLENVIDMSAEQPTALRQEVAGHVHFPAQDAELEMRGINGAFRAKIRDMIGPKDLVIDRDHDLAFWNLANCPKKFGRAFEPFAAPRSKISNLVTEDDVAQLLPTAGNVTLIKPDDDFVLTKFVGVAHVVRNVEADGSVLTYDSNRNSWAPRLLEVHGLTTINGDCGLPYIIGRNNCPRRFIGFHVGGGNNRPVALCSILTQEIARHNISLFAGSAEMSAVDDVQELSSAQGESELVRMLWAMAPRVEVLGTVEGPGMPGDTKIRKSKLHPDLCPSSETAIGPSKFAPAHLRRFTNASGQTISPTLLAVSKMYPRESDLTQEEVDRAVEGLHLKFPPDRASGVRPMILTLDEAIVGVPSLHHIRSMELSTSMGYEYGTRWKAFGDRKRKGKRRFFDIVEKPSGNVVEFVGGRDTNPFMQEYRKVAARYLQGLPAYPIYCDTLKDERRPREKVESGKTRLFSVGPAHVQVFMRQLFASFAASMVSNNATSPPKVGINPYGPDWRTLYKRMKRFPRIFAGDYGNFDKTLRVELLQGAFQVIKNWFLAYADIHFCNTLKRFIFWLEYQCQLLLPPEYEYYNSEMAEDELWNRLFKIIDAIAYDTAHSVHLLMGILYIISGLLASGHALTTILNCLINILIFKCVFTRRCPDCDFDDHVELAVAGDDNMAAVSDVVAERFNCRTMEEECARMGLEYTDYRKVATASAFHDLHDIEFNKRRFAFDADARLYAPLNRDVVNEMLYWYHKDLGEVLAVREIMRSFAIEMTQYGKSEYARVRLVLVRLLQLAYPQECQNILESLPSWHSISEYMNSVEFKPQMWGTQLTTQWTREETGGEIQQELPVSELDSKVGPPALEAQGYFKRSIPSPMNTENAIEETSINVTHVDRDLPVGMSEIAIPRSLSSTNPYEPIVPSQALTNTYLVDNFTWSGADAIGACIACYRAPEMLMFQQSVQNHLQGYRYMRAGVEVTFRPNSTIFHAGCIILTWLPYYDPCNVTAGADTGEFVSKFGNLHVMANNPSVLLMANTTEPVTILLPYRAPHPYIDLDAYFAATQNPGAIGCIVARVLTPLVIASSGSTPTIDIAVEARFVDLELAGMQNTARSAYPVASVNQYSFVTAQAESVVKSEKRVLSGVAKTAASILRGLRRWPAIGSATAVAADAFTFLGGGLQALDLDKPTSVEAPTITAPRTATDLANIEGLDVATRLALRPMAKTAMDPTLIHTRDSETTISGLSKKMFLIDSFSFNSSQSTGALLADFPVTPMVCYAKAYTTPGSVNIGYQFRPTVPAWYGLFFQNWRGSMLYELIFVCTNMTSASVRIAIHPGGGAVPTPGTRSGDLRTMIVKIKGTTTVRFAVPWETYSMCRSTGGPVGMSSGSSISTLDEQFCNGVISISMVNPVRTSENTADSTVYCVIGATVGPDFQYSVPVSPDRWSTSWSDFSATASSEIVKSQPFCSSGDFAGIVPANFTKDEGIAVVEDFDDIRDLMRRYSLVSGTVGTAGSIVNNARFGYTALAPGASPLHLSSVVSLLGAPFMFWRGSFRTKVISASGSLMVVTHDTKASSYSFPNSTPAFTYRAGWTGTAIGERSIGSEVTVETPWYCNWLSEIPTWNISGSQSGRYRAQRSVMIQPVVDNSTFYVWHSVGDDFDMGTMCAPPMIFAATAVPAAGTIGVYPN